VIDIIHPMKRSACIISFGNRESQTVIESAFSRLEIKTETVLIKKCIHMADISDYFISSTGELSPLEKGFLKDGKKDQSAILAIQKNSIDKIGNLLQKETLFFIEDDFSPESFYIKKIFFRNRVPFFSFGSILPDGDISIVPGSLDIGFNITLLKNYRCQPSSVMPQYPVFNGNIAIEAPPDTIPLRYLLHFRSSPFLVRNIIAALNKFYGNERHPAVSVQDPVRPYNSYSASTRAFQIKNLLGKRGCGFENLSDLPAGTTVLTWSTKRFFALLKAGMRPVPLTKCLVSSIFSSRKTTPEELIFSDPAQHDVNRIYCFVKETGVENLAEMVYKLKS
jgi:hypothetical protein